MCFPSRRREGASPQIHNRNDRTTSALGACPSFHLHFTADQPLRTDRKDISHDQHPDHQFRIDRRSTNGRIMRSKFAANPGQIERSVDLAHQMIFGDRVAKMKLVEQLTLVTLQTAHHGSTSPRIASPQRNHVSRAISTVFCNKIGTVETCRDVRLESVMRTQYQSGRSPTQERTFSMQSRRSSSEAMVTIRLRRVSRSSASARGRFLAASRTSTVRARSVISLLIRITPSVDTMPLSVAT